MDSMVYVCCINVLYACCIFRVVFFVLYEIFILWLFLSRFLETESKTDFTWCKHLPDSSWSYNQIIRVWYLLACPAGFLIRVYYKLSLFNFFFSSFLNLKMLMRKPQGKLKSKWVLLDVIIFLSRFDPVLHVLCRRVYVLCMLFKKYMCCIAVLYFHVIYFTLYLHVIFFCCVFVLFFCVVFLCYIFCVIFLCCTFMLYFLCYISSVVFFLLYSLFYIFGVVF